MVSSTNNEKIEMDVFLSNFLPENYEYNIVSLNIKNISEIKLESSFETIVRVDAKSVDSGKYAKIKK